MKCMIQVALITFGSVILVSSFRIKAKCDQNSVFSASKGYSIPDQPKRFANAKVAGDKRYLNIDEVYEPGYLKGLTVLITGGARGLGRAITDELTKQGENKLILNDNTIYCL
jgi:hypothetical protein